MPPRMILAANPPEARQRAKDGHFLPDETEEGRRGRDQLPEYRRNGGPLGPPDPDLYE